MNSSIAVCYGYIHTYVATATQQLFSLSYNCLVFSYPRRARQTIDSFTEITCIYTVVCLLCVSGVYRYIMYVL